MTSNANATGRNVRPTAGAHELMAAAGRRRMAHAVVVLAVVAAAMFALTTARRVARLGPADVANPSAAAFDPGAPRTAAAVQPGQVVAFTVAVRGVEGLAAFEATLRFDPDVVVPLGVRPGALQPAGSRNVQDADVAGGRLSIGSYNAEGAASTGAGALAHVTFEAVGTGEPAIGLDAEASGTFDRYGNRLPATVDLRPGAEPVYLPRLANGGG